MASSLQINDKIHDKLLPYRNNNVFTIFHLSTDVWLESSYISGNYKYLEEFYQVKQGNKLC